MTTRNLALPALAVLALLTGGRAQREVETPVIKTSRPAAGTQGPVIDVVMGGGSDQDVEMGTDDVVAKAGKRPNGKSEPAISIRRDLASFMSPIVGVTPRRVAPGQSGEVSIVLSMQPGFVLQPGQIDVIYSRSNAAMEFGDWSIDDPKRGLEEGPFHGQPIYENYARIRIPFTVGADAEMTKWAATFQITATVTDASSGGSRGESHGVATTQIDVGPALPNPGVALLRPGDAAGAQASGPTSTGAGRTDGGSPTGGASNRTNPIGAELVTPEAPDPAANGGAAIPMGPGDMARPVSSVNIIVIALGGLVLLLAGIVLFGRGR
jgi:hypothetical protein